MTRRRLAIIATGIALTAGATAGVGSAQADTTPAPPAVVLQSRYLACAGVTDVPVAVCVENPATTIDRLPRARQVVYDLTGVG